MTKPVLAVLATGLLTSVGQTALAACAAIRAKVSNPNESRFIDSSGEWIMVHSVPLEGAWLGRTKLVKMAVGVIEECLAGIPRADWPGIPLILCVAERQRPGRLPGLDETIFGEIQRELATEFAAESLIVPEGRASVGTALKYARNLQVDQEAKYTLVVAVDSLVNWPTLFAYESGGRLLAPRNSNGFMAGEGAAAILIGPSTGMGQMILSGLGAATEPSTIDTDEPLLGQGLARAIKTALSDAGLEFQDLDFRITDLSGEQYYFKEAALAVSRILRKPIENFELWHPAESIGEAGAVGGIAAVVVANTAFLKGYAPGNRVLCHSSGDDGRRSAAIFQFRVN